MKGGASPVAEMDESPDVRGTDFIVIISSEARLLRASTSVSSLDASEVRMSMDGVSMECVDTDAAMQLDASDELDADSLASVRPS